MNGRPTGRPGPLMTGWLLVLPTLLGRGHSRGGALSHTAGLQLKDTWTLVPPFPVPQVHIQAGTQRLGTGKEEGPRQKARGHETACPWSVQKETTHPGRTPDAGGGAGYDQAGCGCRLAGRESGCASLPVRIPRLPVRSCLWAPAIPGLSLHMSPLDFQGRHGSLLRLR